MSKKEYKYDIGWEDCVHKRTTIFEVKPEWEIDTVSLVIECKDCHRIGVADGRVTYEEVQWYEE